MTEKEWDEELKKKIEGLLQRLGVGFYPESMIWKFIEEDRKHQKSETLKRLPEEIYEKLKKEIKDIQNPYPEYLFTQMTDKEWLKINKLLKKEMGFPLDKVSGNLMRNGFEVGRNTIRKLVKDKLKGK